MHSDSISVGCCSSSSALRGRNKGPVSDNAAAVGEGPTAAPGGPGCTAPLADITPRATRVAASGFRSPRNLTSFSRCSRPFLKRPQTLRFLGQSLTKISGSWAVLPCQIRPRPLRSNSVLGLLVVVPPHGQPVCPQVYVKCPRTRVPACLGLP